MSKWVIVCNGEERDSGNKKFEYEVGKHQKIFAPPLEDFQRRGPLGPLLWSPHPAMEGRWNQEEETGRCLPLT